MGNAFHLRKPFFLVGETLAWNQNAAAQVWPEAWAEGHKAGSQFLAITLIPAAPRTYIPYGSREQCKGMGRCFVHPACVSWSGTFRSKLLSFVDSLLRCHILWHHFSPISKHKKCNVFQVRKNGVTDLNFTLMKITLSWPKANLHAAQCSTNPSA